MILSDCGFSLPQSMSMFSSALASGQLGPLMSQFGLPAEAVDAANRGGERQTPTHTQFVPLVLCNHKVRGTKAKNSAPLFCI